MFKINPKSSHLAFKKQVICELFRITPQGYCLSEILKKKRFILNHNRFIYKGL